jgi:HSP20 family protein
VEVLLRARDRTEVTALTELGVDDYPSLGRRLHRTAQHRTGSGPVFLISRRSSPLHSARSTSGERAHGAGKGSAIWGPPCRRAASDPEEESHGVPTTSEVVEGDPGSPQAVSEVGPDRRAILGSSRLDQRFMNRGRHTSPSVRGEEKTMAAPRPIRALSTRPARPAANLDEYLDQLLGASRSALFPRLSPWTELWSPDLEGRWLGALADIEDKGSSYEVRANLPGVRKENIEVRLQGRCLRLEAKVATEKEEKRKNYLSHERSYEGFVRTIDLPEDVESEKIAASYRDGVLTVNLPKSHPEPERKVSVS